ncbi:MAG: type I pullulanase [Lachnospiraceae bacterium]|nr:type I pullulanase [Lachnospiraceae bacterium]
MARTPQEWKEFYLGSSFAGKYDYNGNLGVEATDQGTIFRLYSPCAEWVKLRVYHAGTPEEEGCEEDKPYAVYPMSYGKSGVWYIKSCRNLHGMYYDFTAMIDGEEHCFGDPYARACGVNGKRSMVVDLRKTDPEGFDQDRPPAHGEETVICELHVKDFSWDKSGGFPEEHRGRYLAFTDEGTSLFSKDTNRPTGISYLKRLGITHVQLMPIYDFGSVDEDKATKLHLQGSSAGEPYNWGYDPVNYNVPEGSFSSNPYDGQVRITELKQAVMALHQAGFRVVMDVVYNHTYHMDTPLQHSVPWYFYRINEKGEASNGSGCGNDIASEMNMCHKYIVDSVLYWAREYHIDGFRFDLMGLLDVDLMSDVQQSLDGIYGPGEKLVYGEPWGAAGTHMEKNCVGSDKEHMKFLDKRVGMFHDEIRDAIKGSVFAGERGGFADGVADAGVLRDAYVSCLGGENSPVHNPGQVISYISCHDNFTLWDKLSAVARLHTKGDPEEMRLRQNRLCAAIYMTTPGRPFFLGGEEGARSKGGDDNSYCAPVEENCLDWQALYDHEELISYYRGLIALRKRLPQLCYKGEDAASHFELSCGGGVGIPDGVLVVRTKFEEYPDLFIVYNGSQYQNKIELPEGGFKILCDANSSHYDIPLTVTDEIVVEPVSAMVLQKI